MIQLILQLVFLPLRLLIDCTVGCLIAIICLLTLVAGMIWILSCFGII